MYLFMLVSKFLFVVILGSEFECLGLENQAFGVRGITCTEVGFLMIPGSFFMIWGGLGTKFHDFILPSRLPRNLMTFRGDSGVIPDPGTATGGWERNVFWPIF